MSSTQRHVRGSSLLFAGRGLAVAINLVSQVLVVRALDKGEFGAFALGLTLVTLGVNLGLVSMHRGLARFVPLYEERGDLARSRGAIRVGLTVGVGASLVIAALVIGLRGLWTPEVGAQDARLLLVMVLLVPLDALDALLQALAAVFLGAKAIFVRRHLIAPLARLAAVAAVLAIEGDHIALAWGYVIASSLGVVVYGPPLMRALTRRGHGSVEAEAPWAELTAFSAPLLVPGLLLVLKAHLAILLLEAWQGTEAVAGYRAVVSPAALVLIVLESFKPLYVPAATRLFARGEAREGADLHWTTTRWVLVFSFPAAALCLAAPYELARGLFGARYADSGAILAVLAGANLIHAALGMNAYTLQVHGRVRLLTIGSVLALGAGLLVHRTCIPMWGGTGAALGTATILVVQGAWELGCALRATTVGAPGRTTVGLALVATASGFALYAMGPLGAPLALRLVAAVVASIGLLHVARRSLDVSGTFPELGKLPVLGPWLIGGAPCKP